MPRISQTEGLCRESWRFRKGKKEERAGEHVILFLGFLPKHVSPQDHLCLFNVYPSQIYCSLALQERHTLEVCLCVGGVVIIVNISDFVVLKSLSQHWGFYLENVLLCENWRGCNLQPVKWAQSAPSTSSCHQRNYRGEDWHLWWESPVGTSSKQWFLTT